MATSGKPEETARALIAKFKAGDKPPIDVERIARGLDITVRYEQFAEDLSGVLVKEPKRVLIGVNSAHTVTRQRFTIAHECGHYALEHKGELFVDKTYRSHAVRLNRDGKSSLGIDADEIAANRFAAELLMPASMVAAEIKRQLQAKVKLSSSELVAQLATRFNVSTQAMEYRLTNLGYLIPG